jgi:hypothetical protein
VTSLWLTAALALSAVIPSASVVILSEAKDLLSRYAADPTMNVVLHPVREGADVAAIDVRVEVRGVTLARQPFSVRAPIVYASVGGIADRIERLEVRDSIGVVKLDTLDDPVNRGGFPYYRHWRATRDVTYPVVLTYRSLPQSAPPVTGPQFAFRAHDGGLSSAGSGFMALPEVGGRLAIHVHWDLSALAAGSIAASTYGEGDVDVVGPPDRLIQAYYMVGPIGRFAPPGATGGFVAYWLGQPPFDAQREMEWASRSYAFQQAFFHDSSARSYRMFVRAVPTARAPLGGTALQNSFMVGTMSGRADSATGPRETIAHEMGHMFVGSIPGGGGGPWFTEGLNVYYTRLLLLRSGLEPVSTYERSVNGTARAYYASPYRNAPADSLDRLGFSLGVGAGSAQNVPYNRGSLYFALVDSKIRAASSGARRLDDIILPLFEQRRRGEMWNAANLVAVFAKEYGPSALNDFQRLIVRGETVVPPSDAFGPCFERHETHSSVQGRDVAGYEWVRVPSVPDEKCRAW